MNMAQPRTAVRSPGLSGRSAASESGGGSRLRGLTWTLPSDPSRQARNAASGGSAELTVRNAPG